MASPLRVSLAQVLGLRAGRAYRGLWGRRGLTGFKGPRGLVGFMSFLCLHRGLRAGLTAQIHVLKWLDSPEP